MYKEFSHKQPPLQIPEINQSGNSKTNVQEMGQVLKPYYKRNRKDHLSLEFNQKPLKSVDRESHVKKKLGKLQFEEHFDIFRT